MTEQRYKAVRRQPINHGVRAFVMTGAGNYSKWQTLELLIRRWADIEVVAGLDVGPFICSVTQASVARLTPQYLRRGLLALTASLTALSGDA